MKQPQLNFLRSSSLLHFSLWTTYPLGSIGLKVILTNTPKRQKEKKKKHGWRYQISWCCDFFTILCAYEIGLKLMKLAYFFFLELRSDRMKGCKECRVPERQQMNVLSYRNWNKLFVLFWKLYNNLTQRNFKFLCVQFCNERIGHRLPKPHSWILEAFYRIHITSITRKLTTVLSPKPPL